ncbi:hypothetical protein H0H92_010155 [Tricholoma furcatifolium]|nr:hypothetical protein H0H92_010155 [Tricholoma furcatifolium]
MQDINAALRRPHGEAVKKSKYFHRRQNERRAEVQEQEYYDEQDDYISDEMYSAGMYTRSPSPVQNFRPVTPPLFPAITPPLTPPSRSVTLPSQSHVTVATISPQQLIARRVSPSPPAIAGPGPSTVANRQSRAEQQANRQREATPVAEDTSMDEFLNMGDDAPMDDEDTRDEFLKDFEGL